MSVELPANVTEATFVKKRKLGSRFAAGTQALSETECSSEIQTGEACLGTGYQIN